MKAIILWKHDLVQKGGLPGIEAVRHIREMWRLSRRTNRRLVLMCHIMPDFREPLSHSLVAMFDQVFFVCGETVRCYKNRNGPYTDDPPPIHMWTEPLQDVWLLWQKHRPKIFQARSGR